MKILVTGAAGFIGSKLCLELAKRGDKVVGVDNINDYYDPALKFARLAQNGFCDNSQPYTDLPSCKMLTSTTYPTLRFMRMSIEDKELLDYIFETESFDTVVNLAAQAGVRYSITNPYSYMQSNLVGFLNILEACRHRHVSNLVFASSSSVYGLNEKVPYTEEDKVDTPVSLYAASKKSNELMAHCYAKLYGISVRGLRFFTVYGPWGRPDMAPMRFAKAISADQPIQVYNNGDMIRDFTYIDDIVEGTIRVIDYHPDPKSLPHGVPYEIFNIGCSNPVKLMDFINEIEHALGKKAQKIFLPMQPGDVYQTNADTTKLEQCVGYKPHWSLHEGITSFIDWYREYYR